jgi:hypothetical protein
MARGGVVHRAQVVRIEKGGVVVSTPERCFHGGEDLSVWLKAEEQSYRFEASVIRAGVPVPDRGRGGLMLGFIECFNQDTTEAAESEVRLDIIPPSGPPVSLLHTPARLLHLAVDGLTFSMLRSSKLVFVQSGQVDVEICASDLGVGRISARVRTLSKGEDYLLYDLEFEEVGDGARHRDLVQRLAGKFDS